MKRKLSDSSGTYRDLGFQARDVKFGFFRSLGSSTDLLEPVFVLSNFFQIGTYLVIRDSFHKSHTAIGYV